MKRSGVMALRCAAVVFFSLIFTACGGGGGGGSSNPYPGEGTPYNPLHLGTAGTSTLVHAGNVAAGGDSFYTFTTGTTAGTYTIGLTNTGSDLAWGIFTDTTTTAFHVCDNIYAAGDEICPVPLTASTLYYLKVGEFDGIAGSYTLSIAPPLP